MQYTRKKAQSEEQTPVLVVNCIFASILNRLVAFHKAENVQKDE